MDVVKERLQVEGQLKTSKSYGGTVEAVRGIVRFEGLRGLYRAYWMHQATWAPFNVGLGTRATALCPPVWY